MGVERVVTDAAVFEAADKLVAAGEKPTNRAIWNTVGGGSMTTISQALRHWRERQELQVEPPIERAPLPAAIADALHEAAAKLWQAALDQTKSELDQLAQATNVRVAEAQTERDEALAELQTTAEDLEQIKTELAAAREEIRLKTGQIANDAGEIDHLKQSLITASHRADIAEASRVELQARVEQLTELLGEEQTARQEAEADAYTVRTDVARLTAELDASKRRVEEASALLGREQKQREDLQDTFKKMINKVGYVKPAAQIQSPTKNKSK